MQADHSEIMGAVASPKLTASWKSLSFHYVRNSSRNIEGFFLLLVTSKYLLLKDERS